MKTLLRCFWIGVLGLAIFNFWFFDSMMLARLSWKNILYTTHAHSNYYYGIFYRFYLNKSSCSVNGFTVKNFHTHRNPPSTISALSGACVVEIPVFSRDEAQRRASFQTRRVLYVPQPRKFSLANRHWFAHRCSPR